MERADAEVERAKAALAKALSGDSEEQLVAQESRLSAEVEAAAIAAVCSSCASLEEVQAEQARLERELQTVTAGIENAKIRLAHLDGALGGFERAYPDGGAALEESVASLEAQERRLAEARRAAEMARVAIAEAKETVHRDFAPILNASMGSIAASIAGGRYAETFVNPEDFSVRVRLPETGAYASVDVLSSGAREQLFVALRSAIAGALGCGERVPLIFDDSFAHADEQRLQAAVRCLAQLASSGQQILLCSQRGAVVEAGRGIEGVRILQLDGPAA